MDLTVIQNKIYEIRGMKVMLDFDLAQMYQVETKVLNQAVKRNIKRFPSDFMFQLNEGEYINLKSQNVTSSWGGTRKLPKAFTEQGLAMLSGILNSDIAIEVNISIMRAFVQVRKALIFKPVDNKVADLENQVNSLRAYMEEVFSDYNDINEDTAMQLELINQTLSELSAKQEVGHNFKNRKKIGFKEG